MPLIYQQHLLFHGINALMAISCSQCIFVSMKTVFHLFGINRLLLMLFCSLAFGCAKSGDRNLFDGELVVCSSNPVTGFYRDGYCRTGRDDDGKHVVCAKVTGEFLKYSLAQGNDLVSSTERFPGLREGDRWCLCASRWLEAWHAGVAPPIDPDATLQETQQWVPTDVLDKAVHVGQTPDL